MLITMSMRHRATRGAVSLLAIVALVTLFASPSWLQAADATRPATPHFRIVTFDGKVYDNASLKGQPTLLMFWASWCQVCQRELPILSHFYQKEKPAQLRVLAIGFADTRANIEGYVKTHPGTFVFPTAYDKADEVAQLFGIVATPTFVALDARGNISLVHRGGRLSEDPQYRSFLASLQ